MGDDPTTQPLVEWLTRWFDQGDELALRRAKDLLEATLEPTPQARRVLGSAFASDLCRDLLTALLDRSTGQLRGVASPLAYARTALRHRLASELRKWGPRSDRAPEVARHLEALAPRIPQQNVEVTIDAERALDLAQTLTPKRRLAVLLTTRPNRISTEDWSLLVAGHPPPPPRRPELALDRDEAAALLYPAPPDETSAQREQRLNTFDHAYKRALRDIREKLEGTP